MDNKEWLVFDCVHKKPGQTKEDIVRAMKGSYSRVPVLNALSTLEEYEMIVVRPVNSQKHRVFPNDKSLLMSVIQDINYFKEKFCDLLDTIDHKGKMSTLVLKKGTELPRGHSLLSECLIIYNQFLRVFLFQAMVKWSKEEALDKQIINRLYNTIFPAILEIQLKFQGTVTLLNTCWR